MFSIASSIEEINEESTYVIISKKMKELSKGNSINLDYHVIVNSKMLLHAAFSFETKDNFYNHIKHCSYLILLVRNIYFHKYEDVSTNINKF